MAQASAAQVVEHDRRLFWGCFIALVATSFGFIARVLTAGEWGAEFGLTETQVGEILGAGLWPFAISIVLFSLVIDRIGYKAAMWFGLLCHTLSTVLIFFAQDYTMMYLGTFVLALGSGTVEAYANPLVATVFHREKTKWLNILHAGWAGGLVFGGILAIMLGDLYWKYKIAIILIPTVIYMVMLAPKYFPVNERVLAGVSYRDMLREVGALGAFIAAAMVITQIGQVLELGTMVTWILIIATTAAFGWYTRSLGRPLFILMLLIMIPLATTELGVDSWITALMQGEMSRIGIDAGWVLVYTSAIMLVLRFFAGPIVEKISPFGLLAVSSLIAAVGLFALSASTGAMILIAATLYGIGKSFLWPTSLAVVAEQSPRGGAMTLNVIAGVGMLAVGIIGAPVMGYFQDINVDENLAVVAPALHSQVMVERSSIFGDYQGVDAAIAAELPAEESSTLGAVQEESQKDALQTMALLPIFMMLFYIAMILYFRSQGGYRSVSLVEESEAQLAAGRAAP